MPGDEASARRWRSRCSDTDSSNLALPRIVAIANLDNLASQRVLTKAGLLRRGERALLHPAYAEQGAMAWFERDAADWLGERGARDRQEDPNAQPS